MMGARAVLRGIGRILGLAVVVAGLGYGFSGFEQGTAAPVTTPGRLGLVGLGALAAYTLCLAVPVSIGQRVWADIRATWQEVSWLRLRARDRRRQRREPPLGSPASPEQALERVLSALEVSEDLRGSVTFNGHAQPLRASGELLGEDYEVGALAHVFRYGEQGRQLPPGPYDVADVAGLDPGIHLAARVVGARVPALLPSPIDQNEYLVGALLCRRYGALCPREIELRCAQHGRSFEALWAAVDAYLSAYRYAPSGDHGIRVLHLPPLPTLERDAGGSPLPALVTPGN